MLGKFGILIAILALVLLFILSSFGAGAFKKDGVKPETKRYLKSVNILLLLVALVMVQYWCYFFKLASYTTR